MKKIFLTLLLFSSIFAQANKLLTLSPSAHTSSIGNVMLPLMSPARNHLDSDKFTFSRVNWLSNIVSDMNYMHVNLSKGSFDFHTLIFNYGEQLETDVTGVVTGRFSPMSSIWGVSWGSKIKGYNLGITGKVIQHDLYVQKTFGTAFDIATYLPKVYKDLDVDIALRNFGFGKGFNEYGKIIDSNNNKYPFFRKNMIVIRISKKYFRPNEVNNLIGNATKAKRLLKWKPKINIKNLIREMIDTDLEYIRKLKMK